MKCAALRRRASLFRSTSIGNAGSAGLSADLDVIDGHLESC